MRHLLSRTDRLARTTLALAVTGVTVLCLVGRWSAAGEDVLSRNVLQKAPLGAGTDWDVAITEEGLEKEPLAGHRQPGVETRTESRFETETVGESSSDWFQQLPRIRRPVKFYVDKRGVYRVSVSALLDSGFDWRGVPCSALQLFCQGKQVPIWVDDRDGDGLFDGDDAIEFWGEPYRPQPRADAPDIYYSNYTRVNAYWLVETSAGPAERLIALSGSPTKLPAYRPRWFPWTEHFEEDRGFFRLGRVPYPVERDHWFWGRITGGHLQSFQFELPWPDTTTAMIVKVRACLHGRTYGDLGQHAARLVLGTQDVGQVLHWTDQNLLITETSENFPLYADALQPGVNEFSVLNLNPDEANEILFNWFELTYPRQYKAWNDELEFTVPSFAVGSRVRFQLEGFTSDDVDVYKIGVGKFFGTKLELVEEETKQGIEQFWRIEFEDQVESESVHYVAVAVTRKRVPRAIKGASYPILWTSGAGVDYLVVAPDSFLNSPAIDSLVTLRRHDGLRVWKVSTESIYDNFNWGIYSPLAIQRFTRRLLRDWPKPPRFLLLVGASRRRRECFGNPGVLVPAPIVQTVKYGALPSDNQFVTASTLDAHPEIAVGRLPVANLAELSLVVRKLWRYQSQKDGIWHNRILMIAGMDRVFKQQTQTILENRWDRGFDLRRLDAAPSTPPFLGGSEDLLAYWNDGVGLINFMGHGGGMVWADARLLTFDEVPKIANGDKLPFVTSMTCFTGAFEAGPHCLGNALVLHPAGGAIAVLGSAGLGWIWNDYYLLNELVHALQDTAVHTLGEAVRVAKTRYYDRFGSSLATTMVNQYTLLGDPATPILLPRREIEVRAIHEARNSISLQVRANANLHRVQLLWPNFLMPLAEYELSGETGPISLTVPEPAASQVESLAVRLVGYAESTGGLAHGFTDVASGASSIDSIWWEPPRPAEGDSVEFWLKIAGLTEDAFGEVTGSIPVQTLVLEPTETAGIWKSRGRIGFLAPGDYAVAFSFRSADSLLLVRKALRFGVQPRDPVRLRWSSFGLRDSGGKVFAEISLTNQTAEEKQVAVRLLWRFDEGTEWQALGADTLTLAPFGNAWVALPFAPPFGSLNLRAEVLDLAGQVLAEAERRLVSSYLRIVNGRLENVPGAADTVAVGGFALAVFGKETGTVQVELRRLPPDLEAQGNLEPVSTSALFVRQLGPELVRLDVRSLQADVGGNELRLCLYDSSAGVWTALRSSERGSPWKVLVASGFLGLFRVNDSAGPSIRFLAEGRPLVSDGAVSPHSAVEIVAVDLNGVAPATEWILVLDGRKLQLGAQASVTTANRSQVVVKVEAPDEGGRHVLSVQVPDAVGNWSAPVDLSFEVSTEQKLTFVGNFPNPFDEQTVFAFRTAQGFERFSLSVFSTSGRKVRTLGPADSEDPNLFGAGYHEVVWDGKDQHGQDVAYGVYFFKLSVLSEGKWLTHVGKIARVP